MNNYNLKRKRKPIKVINHEDCLSPCKHEQKRLNKLYKELCNHLNRQQILNAKLVKSILTSRELRAYLDKFNFEMPYTKEQLDIIQDRHHRHMERIQFQHDVDRRP